MEQDGTLAFRYNITNRLDSLNTCTCTLKQLFVSMQVLATGCRLHKLFANSTFVENIGMEVVEKIYYAHMSQVNSLNPKATLS